MLPEFLINWNKLAGARVVLNLISEFSIFHRATLTRKSEGRIIQKDEISWISGGLLSVILWISEF